jgi:hypothetical protein
MHRLLRTAAAAILVFGCGDRSAPGPGTPSSQAGGDAVLAKARASYEEGEYRWTATVLNHLVFAQPEDGEAKELLA